MPSRFRLDTDRTGRMRLCEQLDILAMPDRTRRNVTKRMGRQVVKEAKANIRQQRTVSGTSMAKRKRTRTRRKMLRGFARDIKVYHNGPDSAKVTWPGLWEPKIAYRHQFGIPEPWTAAKAEQVYKRPDYSKPATRAQAKSLLAEGYRLRVARGNGKGCTLRRVPVKWIVEHLSRGQAGLILRVLRTGSRHGKQRWEVTPAARPFLGPKPGSEDAFLNELARTALDGIMNR